VGTGFFIKDQFYPTGQGEIQSGNCERIMKQAFQVANSAGSKRMVEMKKTFGALVRQLPSETECQPFEEITIPRWVSVWLCRK